ncbi:hypothetical protein ACLMJK_002964 [Lecanora helva]
MISAASIPLEGSLFRLPSQNLTLLSPLIGNTTVKDVGKWPDTPFSRHLAEETDIKIINCEPPSLSRPVPESAVVGDIRLLASTVRKEGTRMAMMQDWHRQSGFVEFGFHSGGHFFFRGSEIALILDLLADLTNLYGAAGIYGRLVNGNIYIAEFEIALNV